MKKSLIIIALFIQLGFLGYLIFSHYHVLKTGDIFYAKVSLKDPYEPFRGNYILLDYEFLNLANTNKHYNYDDTYYAQIAKNKTNIKITKISQKKPNSLFVKGQIRYFYLKNKKNYKLEISSIKRFFLQQKLAQKAEKILPTKDLTAKLRLKNGKLLIEDILVNSTPIKQFLKDSFAKTN